MLVGITVLVCNPPPGPPGTHRPDVAVHPGPGCGRATTSRRRSSVVGMLFILLLRGLEYALGAGDVSHFPLTFFIGGAFARPADVEPREPGLLGRRREDRHIDGLADRHRAQRHHGRGPGTASPRSRTSFLKRGGGVATALGAAQAAHPLNGEPVELRAARRPRRGCSSRRRARSRTSPGRACSTSPPARNADRCQSQCPAWNTGKPLSPKLLVMGPAGARLCQGAVPAGRWW